MQSLHEQTAGEAGLADAGRADEDDILGFGDEVELGERAKLSLGDTGLFAEGKRLEGPLLWESAAFDPPAEGGLLSMMPLSAQEADEEGFVGELGFVGVDELLVEDLGDSFEVEVF